MTVPYQHLKYRDNVCIEDWNPFEFMVACVGPVREILRQKSLSSSFNPYGPYWVCPSTLHVALEVPSSCCQGALPAPGKCTPGSGDSSTNGLWQPHANMTPLREKIKINYQSPRVGYIMIRMIHVQECTRLHKIVQAFTCPFQPSRIVPTCPGRKPGMTYCDKLGDTSVISTTSLLQSADLWDVLWEPAWLWEPATLVNIGHHIGHLWSPNQFLLFSQLVSTGASFATSTLQDSNSVQSLWHFVTAKGALGANEKQPSFLIARCLSLFIPVQSYLHSSYKALSRQLSSVTAWSRGMAEGKRMPPARQWKAGAATEWP